VNLQPLSNHFTENQLRPQIVQLAASRLDQAADAAGIHLDGQRDDLVEIAVSVLMDGDEIEPETEVGRLLVGVVDQVLTEARAGGDDLALTLLLWHRFQYGEETSLPEHAVNALDWFTKQFTVKHGRGGGRHGLRRARLA